MGNPPKNKPAARKAQAQQYLPSGENASSGTGTGGAISESAVIQIKLVKLVPSVLSQISVNDSVTLVWQNDGYYCLYNSAQLGKVPANYNAQLQPATFYSAVVVKFSQEPAVAIVEVNL